ncbi:MAG: 16S rRNA (cytosine(1402)-N(4))-methyltransferase RsmH [Planctomycetota bacterium]
MVDEDGPDDAEPEAASEEIALPGERGRRSTRAGEHRAVLLEEVLACIKPREGMRGVDCTVGWGGHSAELLKRMGPTGLLIGMDFDGQNIDKARLRLEEVGFPYRLHHGNFAGIQRAIGTSLAERAIGGEQGGTQVDWVLADLGISSMQLDDSERGFSYMRDGPLDMRMDPTRGMTAADLLAKISKEELRDALATLGDEPAAAWIAASIIEARNREPITRTRQLSQILLEATVDPRERRHPDQPLLPNRWNNRPLARAFQALRILVNRELMNLEALLRVLPSCLKPGGVAAIISFHSGEDRQVKRAFREGLKSGVYEEVSKEPIRPTAEECVSNPRSRSAKLRWARRAYEA